MEGILKDVKQGVYFTHPYNAKFREGTLKAFIMRQHRPLNGQWVYVCFSAKIHGIIRIKEVRGISIEEFNRLRHLHFTTDFERKIRWGKSEPLYLYTFELVKHFNEPIQYNYRVGQHSFVDNIEVNNAERKIEETQ